MKTIRRIIIGSLLLSSLISGLSAQKIELKGLIREAGSNETLAFVNVVLQTPDSVFVAGTTSDDKGKFVLSNVAPGDYQLALSYIGYQTQYIALEGLNASLTIPDIRMEEESVGLNAITVTGSAVTSRIDRKLIFPTERQVSASSNGVDLLQQLMLPRLQVDPLTRAVGVIGGGEMQLRINGVKVEVNDIMALLPKDIIRIEYHDNPGLRYGNAAAVINYIVRHHETGGNLGVNSYNTFRLKELGNNGINGRMNHKKSEFAVNYNFSQRDMNRMWRGNEETFHFTDGSTFRRKEVGEPGAYQTVWQNLNMAYNYLNDRRMLNATFRYGSENQPHLDYHGKLYDMENPNEYVRMFDGEKIQASRPAIDLYYQENLKHDQTLTVNLVTTYNATDNTRIYTESRDNAYLTDINNSVTGNKYSWIGESIYEKKFGAGSLSAGLRHTQSYADNTYRNGGHTYRTEMQQGETFLFSEWKGSFRKLDYTLGAGLTRSSFLQENDGKEYAYYTLNPRLALFHPLSGNSSVRLTARINNQMPSLSELSAVEQSIDSIQIQRGNSALKPFHSYQSELNYEWRKGIFQANLQGMYWYRPEAIMEEKFWEGNQIVQTWNNQKSWQWITAMLNLRIGPVKDIVTLSLNGGVNHYISHGNTYRHVYDNPFFSTVVTANYRHFQAIFLYNYAWDWFYGETMQGGETYYKPSISYKYRNMSFGAGFYSNSRQNTENKSKYASYKRYKYYNGKSHSFFFTFTWNIDFGRTIQSAQKRLNNADNDVGVMKVGK
ncbi:MAG: TonB-dependent receptor [Dysgonamonadaceae bacterium]|jgi:hypothetical protein|nr:TonB-dependent receptor [Dysgonamonadaceae bacterium]